MLSRYSMNHVAWFSTTVWSKDNRKDEGEWECVTIANIMCFHTCVYRTKIYKNVTEQHFNTCRHSVNLWVSVTIIYCLSNFLWTTMITMNCSPNSQLLWCWRAWWPPLCQRRELTHKCLSLAAQKKWGRQLLFSVCIHDAALVRIYVRTYVRGVLVKNICVLTHVIYTYCTCRQCSGSMGLRWSKTRERYSWAFWHS